MSDPATKVQNVWSPMYVDGMVLRDVTMSGGGGADLPAGEDASQSEGLVDPGVARPIPTVAGRLYVQQDANWNVTSLTDASGNVVERFVYDPYGSVSYRNADWTAASGDAFTFNYLHQGGRFDQVTGLMNFRNRDESPTLGRWMQQDPARFIDGLNIYSAEASNPIHYTDPGGEALTKDDLVDMLKNIARLKDAAIKAKAWARVEELMVEEARLRGLYHDLMNPPPTIPPPGGGDLPGGGYLIGPFIPSFMFPDWAQPGYRPGMRGPLADAGGAPAYA